ncbi:MAG TPA: hypothetical protein VJ553_04150 [Candidatus Paceibacterota bacterium]|nr:hypothetical protein [Candidatus Paceibacterota bacterium]
MSETELKNKVMQIIRSGQAHMRPRWQFVLRAVLVVSGIVLAAFTLIYLVSFIIFTLRVTGVLYVPLYRIVGMQLLLRSMPWLLVLLAVAFIALVEILVRRYSFSYRQPLLYSALAIILLAFIGGAVIERTHLHAQFFRHARNGGLPIMGPIYRDFGARPLPGLHRGIVRDLQPEGFTLQTYVEGDLRVVIVPQTRPLRMPLRDGVPAVVLGPLDRDVIQAREILPIGPTEAPEWR